MEPITNLDVKDSADTSSVAADTSVDNASDVKVDSSTTDVAKVPSEKAPETMGDAIKQALEAREKGSQPKTEAKPESDVQNLNKTKEAGKEKDGEKEEVAEGETETVETEEKGPVPLERFQEVVKERRELEQKLNDYQPLAEQHQRNVQYCQEAGITPEQYREALEVQALINNNPAEALKRLTSIVDTLQGVTGGKLPADLQGEVDAGELPLQRAKEIAQLRAQQQFGQQRMAASQRSAQEQAQRREQESLMQASQSWEQQKRKTDPDYKPRSDKESPVGKWELTRACFLDKLHAQDDKGRYVNQANTPAQMTALLEEAYNEVSRSFQANRPKPPAKRALTHNGSSTNPPKSYADAKTMKEAIEMAVANNR